MIGIVLGYLLLLGAVGALLVAIVDNRLEPNYVTALTVPIVNAAGLAVAMLAVLLLLALYWHGNRRPAMKRAIAVGLVVMLGLAVLFPFADRGALSVR